MCSACFHGAAKSIVFVLFERWSGGGKPATCRLRRARCSRSPFVVRWLPLRETLTRVTLGSAGILPAVVGMLPTSGYL
jgi:hypothetical protein